MDVPKGSERERELAHLLLVELLAHQFAMPVRWIETQEILLVGQNAERIVEVGPSPVLNNMMAKTIEQFHTERDLITGTNRRLYCVAKNYNDICYATDEIQDALEDTQTPEVMEATTNSVLIPAVQEVSKVQGIPTISVTQEAIPDKAVSASEALLALIGSNLRKSPSDLRPDETISGLANGKSIVQNEMISDLIAEFGTLPDGVEQMALQDVITSVDRNYRGVLGKCLLPRVSKMLASKFPASVESSTLRTHLLSQWGLQAGRQDSVLLLMLARQPVSRLSQSTDAFDFMDNVAKEYLQQHQLQLPVSRPQTGNGTSGSALGQQDVDQIIRRVQHERYTTHNSIASSIMAEIREKEEISEPQQHAEQLLLAAQAELDSHSLELGEDYLDNIRGKFHPDQCRSYDSTWNWVAVDLVELYFRLVRGDWMPAFQEIERTRVRFANRWDSRLTVMRSYLASKLDLIAPQSATIFRTILDFDTDVKTSPPIISAPVPIDNAIESCTQFGVKLVGKPSKLDSILVPSTPTLKKKRGSIGKKKIDRITSDLSSITTTPRRSSLSEVHQRIEVLRRHGGENAWKRDEYLSRRLTPFRIASLQKRHAFAGKTALITGAGPDSIASGLLPGLLQGGARIILATSRPLSDCATAFQSLFTKYGGFGSNLILVPFNRASKNDIANLFDYIYDPVTGGGLGGDLDYVIPFAAIPQTGRGVDNIDGKAELAYRAMSTNVVRLLGAVKAKKAARGIITRPAQVILPLSPNTGTFGNDGLYAESKASLLVLLNKWLSEEWAEYLCLCGVLIGWTTGTGLMSGNDELASTMREMGVTTFSQTRMSQYILKLMCDPFVGACQDECLLVNLSGGLDTISNMGKLAAGIRHSIRARTTLERALESEVLLDVMSIRGTSLSQQQLPNLNSTKSRVNMKLPLPNLSGFHSKIQPLRSQLEGMVDLSTTVVICGFAEVGPLGSARSRWEKEVSGGFSTEACLELAWMTGLIRYTQIPSTDSTQSLYGWLDAQTGEAVEDWEVKDRYENRLLEHTGLRLVQPKQMDPTTREHTETMQEILIQQDLKPFNTTFENALEFVSGQKDKVDISPVVGTDEYSVRLKTGARVFVPKAAEFDRIVGGQLPQGWDPRVYGLPEDICDSVDECTVMALVCAAEAFLSAGITDVYDLYKNMHLSELANCVGSGAGGLQSSQKLFRERFLEKDVQSDILAETFINTTAAWVNMLLMGSCGPIRTPVGACATALESLNQGYDLISSGGTKICLVGGVDTMVHDTSNGFARMNATNNTSADLQAGRSPSESSRPTTTTRAGFVESEGCGMQILASAQTALDLGLPIWAIVADVRMASDGTGKSVPAPGQGLLANVRSAPRLLPSPLLSIDYRRRVLKQRLSGIRESKQFAVEQLIRQYGVSHISELPQDAAEALLHIDLSMKRDIRMARQALGNSFWIHDQSISPLKGALAVWGLTIDDVAVVSIHGTSTKANEKNECEVLHRQFEELGRTRGNPALVVCQKYLTGHPKAAAGAWMLNGCCQIMDQGMVPGNRNADNIDVALKRWDHLLFPDRTIEVGEMKAFGLTSFGFGQKGAQAIGVHPMYCYAVTSGGEFEAYQVRREERYRRAQKRFQNSFYGRKMVDIKDEPPYDANQRLRAFVDTSFRCSL